MNILVRWQQPQGWTFVIYPTRKGGGEGRKVLAEPQTQLPVALAPLSSVLPGFSDKDPAAVEARKQVIAEALKSHYPDATVEFSPAPQK